MSQSASRTTPGNGPHGSDLTGTELRDARETERLGAYLRGLWERREWMWYVSSSQLRSQQINTVLGNLWHLLNPLLLVGTFFLFFGLLLSADRGVGNFLAYLTIGIFTYTYTQKNTIAGGKSMTKFQRLMQMISFPRALIPLTSTLTEAITALPGYVVIYVVALATGEQPTISWLLLVPFFLIQTTFNAGLALVAARGVEHVSDLQQVLPFVFRLGFYASGVLFNVRAYLENSSWQTVFELNPLYCFLEINRGAVLNDHPLEWNLVATASAWAVVVLVGGLLWFRAGEDRYGVE